MKYSLIAASLAAAVFATTVNIDVEDNELTSSDNSRHHIGRHSRGHQHRGNNWWSDLFGGRNDRHEHRGRGRNGKLELDEILEDLFFVNFECTKDAKGSKSDWEKCYEHKSRDITGDLEEVMEYELENGRHHRNRHSRSRSGHRGYNSRYGRHGRHGRYYDAEDLDGERDGKLPSRGGRDDNQEYQCRVESNDRNRVEQIARQCCEQQQQLGRYDPQQQACLIEGREDKQEFEQCAYQQGAEDAFCRKQ